MSETVKLVGSDLRVGQKVKMVGKLWISYDRQSLDYDQTKKQMDTIGRAYATECNDIVRITSISADLNYIRVRTPHNLGSRNGKGGGNINLKFEKVNGKYIRKCMPYGHPVYPGSDLELVF